MVMELPPFSTRGSSAALGTNLSDSAAAVAPGEGAIGLGVAASPFSARSGFGHLPRDRESTMLTLRLCGRRKFTPGQRRHRPGKEGAWPI
ncbi:MAG: hypothetical protein ACREFL_04875 [Stellaceae bacterium]